ncbi:MAG: hypothetical protein LBT76_07070 [Tannerella sp.]|jgi:hypothetical protein|nr:hypothetical protein [Tannerella sp.]
MKTIAANDKIYETLLTQVRSKIPQNTKLVNTLVDILFIEKEAVYRRLRGEVPFTFSEIVTITRNLGISLDAIIGIEGYKSRPLQLKLPHFLNPKKNDLIMNDGYISTLEKVTACEDTEMAVLTNIVPQDIFPEFDLLTKYIVFKWQYHSQNKALPFHEINIPDSTIRFFKAQLVCTRQIKRTSYVFDNQLCRYIVDDINYFRSIRMIREEDVLNVKEDVFRLLDYLEHIAINGVFRETNNKASIYVADVDLTNSYSYIKSKEFNLCSIKAFFLTAATSTDDVIYERVKDWITATLKLSTLITVANEKQRVLYFERQREIVRTL